MLAAHAGLLLRLLLLLLTTGGLTWLLLFHHCLHVAAELPQPERCKGYANGVTGDPRMADGMTTAPHWRLAPHALIHLHQRRGRRAMQHDGDHDRA